MTTGMPKTMATYLKPMINPSQRTIVGRDDLIRIALATLDRKEITNVMLIGEAGTGKTTLVYKMVKTDHTRNRSYYQLDLDTMAEGTASSDGATEMVARMARLFGEVETYQKQTGQQLVIFMDEIHKVIKTSPMAMEALKPILANSGARGLRIIGATTDKEYEEYIRPNQALDERFERINVPELNFEETLSALKSYWRLYVTDTPLNEALLRHIIEVTERAIPSQKQPRKSLRLLDSMVGYHSRWQAPMDEQLMALMTQASLGVNINYRVNVDESERRINQRVFDQGLATRAVVDRLYVSVAELNDTTRPRGSFLFTGPTGVGKTEMAKTMANVLFGSDNRMIRFDMSEYAQPNSVDRLRRNLTDAIWEHPSSIILLDEIEKADGACSKLMLQVLDDARMSDRDGREVSFKESYIIFTTNAGANVFHDLQAQYGRSMQQGETDRERMRQQRKMLQSYLPLITRALRTKAQQFPPELLGRFDTIVPFAPIDEATRYKICDAQLQQLSQLVMTKHAVVLHFDRRVREFVVKEHVGSNDTNNGGGREIRRRIDRHIVAKVAEAIVKYPQVRDLAVVVEGRMAVENKYDVEGTAEIKIGAWRAH